ncbi:Uncharacterized protein BP5553_07945 [Venustampulla echinocandica]|uniref:F-box domain-containing protein n=1 Tax=Venustampulla echinocandica TaxID=2656787 RepID=A0A370TFA5_9HELO|nr:Uncharacterized protein BP5553_07945 [Venustampulla echinocandica]RDL33577.1 Uncharacterized protein BP5553_07945 [Venustampulla echinocandica]
MGSNSPSIESPQMPEVAFPMEDDDRYLHGRVGPSIGHDIFLPEPVEVKRPTGSLSKFHVPWQQKATLPPLTNQPYSSNEAMADQVLPHYPGASVAAKSHLSLLLALPSELLNYIFNFLGPLDLASVSSTCRMLSGHAKLDLYWQRHVQENTPGVQLSSPSPYTSYRELFISHDPHWFLTKYKVWFCDYFLTGKIIICRYDPRRGCIEGYRLVAERSPPTFDPWEADDEVLIHSFKPQCRLHLDQPVLQIDAIKHESPVGSSGESTAFHKFNAETPMRINERSHHGVFSNFLLARPVEELPNMSLWPPPTIPAHSRVRNASQEAFVGAGHKPQKRSQVSDQAFRIRRWMQMTAGSNAPGIHLAEEVYTYATLDPKVYTPTEDKPYRGIWVGDYSGHGCEFLLVHQPDDEEPFDEASVVRGEDETAEEWESRKKEERIYRGSLEAIKLTGDPNVPRGEYTFIADDISKGGFIRTATEQRFKGARIVRSTGHIANPMFRNHTYIESQLIMISPNQLAQYWVGFGHISFFERVDIDQFLSPFSDPQPNLT